MSQSALMLAVREHLREQLNLTDKLCEVMHDGQPPPYAGQEFVAVHQGDWSADPDGIDYGLIELFGVKITVTRRIGQYQIDQIGSEVIAKEDRGLEDRLRQIIVKIHQSYTVMNKANALITDGTDGFVEPLWFTGSEGGTRLVGSSWFYAEPGHGGREECGVAHTITFGRAKRWQAIDTMT